MEQRPARTILLIEDDSGQAQIIDRILDNLGPNAWKLTHVESVSEAERTLAERSFDVVLLELEMYDAQEQEAVRRVRTAAPRVSIVLLSDLENEPFAAQAIQEGAQDYLIKGQIVKGGMKGNHWGGGKGSQWMRWKVGFFGGEGALERSERDPSPPKRVRG